MFRCNTGSDNRQLLCSVTRDMAIGAAGGAPLGLPGALAGAGTAAAQNVALRLIDHGPVNIRMPNVPMNPSHVGNSGHGNSQLPMGPSWTQRR
ncbi:E492 group microcin [Bruguierivorax albus]|uniref:Microcin n=1 Tax=Martelella alba TaxID=2590451 RepID=A0ABY2SF67_9HYPH|nr:microcin [Martelella alba]